MSKRVQLLRHVLAAANAFTGRQGEVTVDTTSVELRVHDGSTAGGIPVARADLGNVAAATTANAGKMTGAQVTELTAATASAAANGSAISTLQGNRAIVEGGSVIRGRAIVGGVSAGLNIVQTGFLLEQQIPPSAAVAVFYQAAAPTLWTRVNDISDHILGFTTGTGGVGNGGTWTISGITANAVATSDTGAVSLTAAQSGLRDHTHGVVTTATLNIDVGSGASGYATNSPGVSGTVTGGALNGAPHQHTAPSYAINPAHSGGWRPPIAWCIRCLKNAAVSAV